MAPTITTPKRTNGVAGQIAYTTTVTYEDEAPRDVTFVGNVYGGPVVMVTQASNGRETQTFVTDPGRFGDFGPEWVRRFFA